MIPAWSRRIERAEELAKTCAPAAEMLRLYAEIARFQKTIYEQQPSDVLPYLPALLALVRRIGPAPLVRMAEECIQVEQGGFFERSETLSPTPTSKPMRPDPPCLLRTSGQACGKPREAPSEPIGLQEPLSELCLG